MLPFLLLSALVFPCYVQRHEPLLFSCLIPFSPFLLRPFSLSFPLCGLPPPLSWDMGFVRFFFFSFLAADGVALRPRRGAPLLGGLFSPFTYSGSRPLSFLYDMPEFLLFTSFPPKEHALYGNLLLTWDRGVFFPPPPLKVIPSLPLW